MTTSVETIEQHELSAAREQAQRIVQLAIKDPAFREKAAHDPEGVLRAFGFPEHAISTFIRHDDHPVDIRCADTTCWSSQCPATCYVTLVSY